MNKNNTELTKGTIVVLKKEGKIQIKNIIFHQTKLNFIG
jgi:hypothetical protein